MNKRSQVAVAAVLAMIPCWTSIRAEDITLDNARPVVVKTVPEAGSDKVDSQLAEIQVTFSKKMADQTWSWVKVSDETFPELKGKPKYLADQRTCVLPVKLKPGKTYALWINREGFENFRDTDGRSAVPYLLVFRTKD